MVNCRSGGVSHRISVCVRDSLGPLGILLEAARDHFGLGDRVRFGVCSGQQAGGVSARGGYTGHIEPRVGLAASVGCRFVRDRVVLPLCA